MDNTPSLFRLPSVRIGHQYLSIACRASFSVRCPDLNAKIVFWPIVATNLCIHHGDNNGNLKQTYTQKQKTIGSVQEEIVIRLRLGKLLINFLPERGQTD